MTYYSLDLVKNDCVTLYVTWEHKPRMDPKSSSYDKLHSKSNFSKSAHSHSPVMKRVIRKLPLILLFSGVTFIAQTLAETPEAVKNEFIAHRQRQREARLSAKGNPTEISSNWAGAIQVSAPGTFNHVSAKWILPTVSRTSANESGIWYVSAWVGIDGWLESCSSAILQAGIDYYLIVFGNGTVTTGTIAWSEWYPDDSITVADISFAAGDTVEFSVTAKSNTSGKAVIKNLSTGFSETVPLHDQSYKLCGATAEWIVEDIGGYFFSNFTTISFQNCKATTTKGSKVNLFNSTLTSMVQNTTVLATATLVNSTELQVSYG